MYKNATFKKVAFLFIIINLYLSDAAIMNKIARHPIKGLKNN